MAKPFFWIDLEMTGLDETKDSILEIGILITNPQFQILESFERIIYQPSEVLQQMNPWCQNTHHESGLTALVPHGKPLVQVEHEILDLVDRHFQAQDRIVIAGNSVHNDRRFLERYLPQLTARLHYRMIDVSSFKEVFRERYHLSFKKQNRHRSVEDLKESIQELQFYLSHIQLPVQA